MEFRHVSVMFSECMKMLNIRPDGIYVDGTLGGGGHSMAAGCKIGADVETAAAMVLAAINEEWPA